jgi:predicted alpha/beta superfamily hydrolase
MHHDRIRIHHQFSSHRLKHARDILVFLPQGYAHRRKRYPVLYMQDGQNLIDPATAFGGVPWHIEKTIDRLTRSRKIPELIVVGIYNAPERTKEYAAGEIGHFYADFVIHELKPLIDRTYRTKPGREFTAAAGSSMGGLISFFFAWHYPEVFSRAACLSSSFFWRNSKMLYDVQIYQGPKKDIRIYLDVGTRERSLIPCFEKMVALLEEKGYIPDVDFLAHCEDGGEHNERSWGERFWRPLTFLFGK